MPRMSAVYLCLAVAASALAGCAPPRPIRIRRSTGALFRSSRRIIRRTMPPCPWSPGMAAHAMCSSRKLALYRTRQSLRSWDRICHRAAPTHTTFSAWPSASPTWFAAARSAPLPRHRRRERRRNTFMAPRAPCQAPWGVAFRARRAPCQRGPGLRARRRSPLRRGERGYTGLGAAGAPLFCGAALMLHRPH